MTFIYYYWPAQILSILTSDQYVQYGELLWLMMLAAAAFNLSQTFSTSGLIDKTPNIYLVPKIGHGAVIICLLLILVPQFDVYGAVLAVLLGNFLQLLAVLFVNYRQSVANTLH